MAARFYSSEDIIDVLRGRIAGRGDQNNIAKTLGVSKGYVSDLLAGKKTAPGDAVLSGLGFDPTPHYRRKRRAA